MKFWYTYFVSFRAAPNDKGDWVLGHLVHRRKGPIATLEDLRSVRDSIEVDVPVEDVAITSVTLLRKTWFRPDLERS